MHEDVEMQNMKSGGMASTNEEVDQEIETPY